MKRGTPNKTDPKVTQISEICKTFFNWLPRQIPNMDMGLIHPVDKKASLFIIIFILNSLNLSAPKLTKHEFCMPG